MSRKYIVELTRVSDSKSVKFEGDYIENDDDAYAIWSIGNFSCDCNRDIMFHEHAGDPIEREDSKCGDCRYLCKVVDDSGKVIIDESRDGRGG